jgi:hypothetical protein
MMAPSIPGNMIISVFTPVDQLIVTWPTVEGVGTRATDQQVVTSTADEDVAATAAEQPLITIASIQYIIATAADKLPLSSCFRTNVLPFPSAAQQRGIISNGVNIISYCSLGSTPCRPVRSCHFALNFACPPQLQHKQEL